MVIHNPDEGRSGIYASETTEGNSNPRIVNATLVGRATQSINALNDETQTQVGILFADNTDQIRLANVLIANFTNGCFNVSDGADLSGIDTSIPGPTYLDGVHCANNNGGNGGFGIVGASATASFPAGTVAPNNSNGDGLVYYNGAANPIVFSGALSDLSETFTANWYLNNIGGRAKAHHSLSLIMTLTKMLQWTHLVMTSHILALHAVATQQTVLSLMVGQLQQLRAKASSSHSLGNNKYIS